MDWAEGSEHIGQAITDAAPEQIEGALLTGWCLVAEFMAPDGERWLSKMHPPHVTGWLADGMHHQALNATWPDD